MMTGWVRVYLEKDGEVRYLRADSFGAAAAQVDCEDGQIIWFEWAPIPGHRSSLAEVLDNAMEAFDPRAK
jgi:hypothetical protein